MRKPDLYCKTRQARQARRGFTLVEVMVALAIFVFGALAILRIFPSALGIVRETEERAAAVRMNRARTSSYESKVAMPPEAVYTASGGAWIEASGPGNVPLGYTGGIGGNSIPQGPQDNINATALGNFRHIHGERATVRIGLIAPTAGANPYVLTRFPYSGSVAVYSEGTLSGVTVGGNGLLDFTRATHSDGSAFNDSANSFPTRPPDSHRHSFNATPTVGDTTYYVSYRWTAFARVQGVKDENLIFHKNAAWAAGTDGCVLQTAAVISGRVQVRYRRYEGSVTPISAPPPITDAAVGLVRLGGSGLSSGAQVLLDYDVSDWRDLLHGDTPSSPAQNPPGTQWNSNVPIQGLDPEFAITALFARPDPEPAPAPPSPPVVDWAWWKDGTPAQSGQARILDVGTSAGRITFDLPPVDVGDPNPPTPTRIAFRTLDLWAHQLGVAARTYEPFMTAGRPARSPREGWREYVWLPGATVEGGRLYFQPSEAGKIVMVSYEYMDGTTPRTITNAIVPVSAELLDTGAISGFPGNFAPITGKVAVAQLTDLFGNPLGAARTMSAVLSVQGVSVLARTAWLRNGRYTQAIAKGMRPLVQ